MSARLGSACKLAAGVTLPGYDRARHEIGIVHIGLGAFHRAHQAVYTDAALSTTGGDWLSVGISLRNPMIADKLNAQDGLYSVLQRDGEGDTVRVTGSIAKAIAAKNNYAEMMDLLTQSKVCIVSITVTEKAYGIVDGGNRINLAHEAIAHDLAYPDQPYGVLGILVAALAQRRDNKIDPFTVLCCDNVPDNGKFLRQGVIAFANEIDANLGSWIADCVAFPATMVDRITPASTVTTLADAKRMLGVEDLMAVETEPFSQWVIKDEFPTGRPNWEAGGAIFVDDVVPYERMKLRMLNGAHSMLAYVGFLRGLTYVRDAIADSHIKVLVQRHLRAAAQTLKPLATIDYTAYAADLLARFTNPTIAHELHQIAMDGTQKLPLRILIPAVDAHRAGQNLRPFAFATAAWMRYCLGKHDDGQVYMLRDPLETQISSRIKAIANPKQIAEQLFNLDSIFPTQLLHVAHWKKDVIAILSTMIEQGVNVAISQEVEMMNA